MIEKIILDYLTSELKVPVSMEKPETEPTEYVLLDKTGSANEDFINTAVIAIQSYAGSLEQAACLNEVVKEAMERIVELDTISKAKLNTDYEFTDTTKKRYRYQAVYEIVY